MNEIFLQAVPLMPASNSELSKAKCSSETKKSITTFTDNLQDCFLRPDRSCVFDMQSALVGGDH